MDLPTSFATSETGTEPHARGDGPDSCPSPRLNWSGAPRTWGWTVICVSPAIRLPPSPTHVGMDRTPSTEYASPATEPHARGDGPATPMAGARCCSRAPRTWGWTAPGDAGQGDECPSPTHVGMDRA